MRRDLAAWLQGSAFVRGGRPTVWFHGTDAEREFDVFTRWDESSIGFHFGTAATASARLSTTRMPDEPDQDGCRVVPVYCRARRPLRLRDHHCWRLDRVAAELHGLGLISEAVFEEIADGCDEFALFAAIEAAGHDCVVYANETESEGRMDDSLLIWRSELVKSVHAPRFDPDDPAILPRADVDRADLDGWRRNAEALAAAAARLAAISATAGPAFG